MIGLVFELIEFMIKATIAMFLFCAWTMVVTFWLLGVGISALTKQPRPAYPQRALNDLSRGMRRLF